MEELNRRKKKFDNLKVISVFLIILGVILMFVVFPINIENESSEGSIYARLFFGAAPGLLLMLYARNEIKKISNQFKATFVKTEIERLIPGAVFDYSRGISESTVRASKLVTLHDIYKTEDLIQGEIKDVDFRCADVLVRDVRKSGKHTTVVTTFQGRFYEFDFPKRFRSNVFLLQPGQFRPFSGMNKIKMESIQFNSEFKIYSNNDHDAFYILTPHLMERLLVLDSKYADRIGFSFLNSKLYIAIDNRVDTFDVTGFGDITQTDINKAVVEIENIIEFVEFLKLDDTLFKQD